MEEIRSHPLRSYRRIHCGIETRLKTVVFPLSGKAKIGEGFLSLCTSYFGSVGSLSVVGEKMAGITAARVSEHQEGV